MKSWVVGRDSQVAPQYRNTDHGTFVAGLICWGSRLNPTISGLDDSPCGVFDLQVIPNDDPAKGDVLPLLESEFLVSLEEALQQHANKYKVWNLSLGTDTVCSLDEFSALAEELDNLQEKYQVSFVISAGNYDTPPLLDFPRTGKPVAGRKNHDAGRQRSRHHGGRGVACRLQEERTEGASPLGLFAARRRTELCDQAGSRSLRRIVLHRPRAHCRNPFSEWNWLCRKSWHELRDAACCPDARADLPSGHANAIACAGAGRLLTHHARDPRTKQRVPDGDENFFGFGLPASGAVLSRMHATHLDACLRRCSPAGIFPRMGRFPLSAVAQPGREIFRRDLDDGRLRAGAGRAVGHGVLRNTHRRAFRRLPQGKLARDGADQAQAEVCRPCAARAQERRGALRVLSGREAAQMGSGANLLRGYGRTASAAIAGA